MTEHSLSVHIVGHVSREGMSEALRASVEADHVWIDHGYHGEWKNHLRAWRSAVESDATHAVVLQDDAVPVDDFRKHVLSAVQHKPDEMISLYTGTHRPRKDMVIAAVAEADRIGASWLTANTLMWGVGVVLPVARIEEVLDTVRKIKLPYDQRLGYWPYKNKRQVYYTWPSLVDHADVATVAHAAKGTQGVRVAHRVGIPNWNEVEVEISAPYLASKRDIV